MNSGRLFSSTNIPSCSIRDFQKPWERSCFAFPLSLRLIGRKCKSGSKLISWRNFEFCTMCTTSRSDRVALVMGGPKGRLMPPLELPAFAFALFDHLIPADRVADFEGL